MEDFQLFYKLSSDEPEKCDDPIFLQRPEILAIRDSITHKVPKDLQYFVKPSIASYPLDLNKGFEQYTFPNENFYKLSLKDIEQYIMENGLSEYRNDSDDDRTKIVATRSVFYVIMLTPYRLHPAPDFNDWTIYAIKFNDVIYMVQKKPVRGHEKNDTYHFKFKQYCFSDSSRKSSETDKPIDDNQYNYCIYQSHLGNFDLLYTAKVNGIFYNRDLKDFTNMAKLNKCRFVSTKLLWIYYTRKWQTEKKLLNWWINAYLINVNDIYMGFKDKNGLVNKPVQYVRVQNLPQNQSWKPHICIQFLHTFLNMMKQKMSHVNCPYTAYEFNYSSTKQTIDYKIHEGETEFSFLSKEFIEFLQRNNE